MALKKKELQTTASADLKERELGKNQESDIPMKLYNMRMPERDLNVLRVHFRTQGLGLSTGIRMIVSRYMQTEGLK